MRTTAAVANAEATPTLWRCGGGQCGAGECEHDDGELHRHAAGPGPAYAPPIVLGVLETPGSPLPTDLRRDMEHTLGHSFADVRIHHDEEAAASAAAVHAHAYTVGRQVVFGAGRYDPGSPAGRRLLAHELTHAAGAAHGAGSGSPAPSGRLRVSRPDEPAEQYAETQALRVAQVSRVGRVAPPTTSHVPTGPTLLMRDADDEGTEPDPQIPLGTGTSGTFKDSLLTSDKSVSIAGIHAADWDSNVKAKLGGDGGKVEVSVDPTTPSLTSAGLIDGLTYSATITKTTATVDTSQFTDAGEKKAAQDLAAALQAHEQKHQDNEVNGRTGFAASMKGKQEKALDPALKALECKVGKAQRKLDNSEGRTTLSSSNTVTQSGVDHPEYEDPCKP